MAPLWFAPLALAASLFTFIACAPASGTASPPATPSSGPREPWQDEWDQIVVAAKQEGRLALAGPQGNENREALTEAFERKYGISIEYFGVGGPELPPRVQQERGAGLYNWDVFIAGTTTLFRGLKPMGALDPIESALILPEVKDPAKWRGGELPFFDNDRIGLSLFRRAGMYFYANPTLVKPDEFRSWRDLLDPKWKGKIVVGRDPRVAGYGRSMFLFFYITPELGPDYIRELAKQDLQILRDDRTAAQWLVQGRYPLCFCSDTDTEALIHAGLPGSVVEPKYMREGVHQTSAYANVALANRAPHPNAAKLYINWVLSQEGGAIFTKSTLSPSTRTDVSTDGVNVWAIPDPAWPTTNIEKYLMLEDPLLELLREVFGP